MCSCLKNAVDFICDCDFSSCIHSTNMNFIDLCRKLVARSTAYNPATSLSVRAGERMGWRGAEQEEGMLPIMQCLPFTESCNI
jgi:hypothetical protein